MAFLPNLVLYYVFVTWINYEKTYAKASNVCENHNYTTISDGRRSTSNLLNATRGDKPICDRTIQDSLWYRFEIANGNQLATKRPEIQHCGTYSPIWMNGSHPTVSQGEVSRKACAYLLVGRLGGCTLSYRIKVLNCSGFYVYRLKPPEQCFLAYCIASNQSSLSSSTTKTPRTTGSNRVTTLAPDIDECTRTPKVCHSHANCSNVTGSFLCQCRSGYEGDGKLNCEVLVGKSDATAKDAEGNQKKP